jgi:hypothetical protein
MALRFGCALALLAAASATAVTLDNGLVQAKISTPGIVSLNDSTRKSSLGFDNDQFEVQFSRPSGMTLSSTRGCTLSPSSAVTGGEVSATVSWTCAAANFTVDAIYELKEGKTFVAKRLHIQSINKSPFTISKISPWAGLSVIGKSDGDVFEVRSNPYFRGGQIVAFGRFKGSQTGFFTSVANPFVLFAQGSGPGPDPESSCVWGKNMKGTDLPGMPLRGETTASCEAKCAADPKCKSYIFLKKGCDGGQPSDACYLKAVAGGPTDTENCSCMAAKPFPPPAPTPVAPTPAPDSITFTVYYSPNMIHDSTAPFDYHPTEDAVIGLTTIGKYPVSATEKPSFNLGERSAFIDCVEAYMLDAPSRANKTVKVNVGKHFFMSTHSTSASFNRHARLSTSHLLPARLSTSHLSSSRLPSSVGSE